MKNSHFIIASALALTACDGSNLSGIPGNSIVNKDAAIDVVLKSNESKIVIKIDCPTTDPQGKANIYTRDAFVPMSGISQSFVDSNKAAVKSCPKPLLESSKVVGNDPMQPGFAYYVAGVTLKAAP